MHTDKRRYLIATLILTSAIILFSTWSFSKTAKAKILILISSRFSPYLAAFSGLEASLSTDMEALDLAVEDISRSSPVTTAKLIMNSHTGLIVTIGTKATMSTVAMNIHVPIVFSMVLDPPDDLLHHPQVTGVLIDIPPAVQLEWIRKICPKVTRIGIIYTRATKHWITRMRPDAERLGLVIVPLMIDNISTLPKILDTLKSNADLLLSIPDGTIYNPVISPRIIMYCIEHKIPLVGLSKNFTRAGALFALECDYRAIGKQTAEMVKEIIRGGSISAIPLAYPRKIKALINLRTARILGIKISTSVLENAEICSD